jgi:hypothetical protein
MNIYSENLHKARSILGSYDALGKACGGLSGNAVKKWRDNGRPPRTEYTGETNYAQLIEEATSGAVSAVDLLPTLSKGN